MFAQRIQFTADGESGTHEVNLQGAVAWLRFVGEQQRDVDIYAGHGKSEPIARVRAYEHRDIELATPTDQLTFAWSDDPATDYVDGAPIDLLATQGSISTTGGQAASVLLARQQAGEPYPWLSLNASAPQRAGVGLVAIVQESNPPGSGIALWDGLPVTKNTFSAVYRRGVRDYNTGIAFGAAGRSMFGTLWNPASSSVYVRLLSVDVWLITTTAAVEVWIDLMRITTEPTGGGGLMTIFTHDTAPSVSPTAEARRAPAGGAAESGGPLSSAVYRLGITAADATTAPAPAVAWQSLWQPAAEYEQQPECIAGEGFGIVIDCNGAATVRVSAQIRWTEESVA